MAATRGGWYEQNGTSSSIPPVVDLTAIPDGSWMIAVLVLGGNIEPAAHPVGWRNPLANPSQQAGTRRMSLAYRTKQAGDTSLSWGSVASVVVSLFVLHGTGAAPDTTSWVTGLIGVRNATNVVSGQSVQAGSSTTTVAPGVAAPADSLVISVLMEATTATGTFGITSGATTWFDAPEENPAIEALSVGYTTPSAGTTGPVTATAVATQASNGMGVQIVLPPPTSGPVERTATASATAVATGAVAVPYRNGFSSVAQMLATPGATWAHRGGSTSWPEMSEYAYTQAALYGYGALEFSAHRTSDGVWIGSHDADLNRTSETTGLPNISTMTWAQVQTYMNTRNSAGTPRPYYRLDDFLDKFTPTHVCIVDPKNDLSRRDEFLALCDAHGGNTKIVVKFFGVGSGSTALADAATAKKYQTWGYFYEDDYLDGDMARDQSHWSILGMSYDASQAAWDAVVSYGKPVTAHIIPSQTAYNTAIAKGATMAQVANVVGVTAVSAGYYSTVSGTATATATPTAVLFRTATGLAAADASATPAMGVTRTASASATASASGAPSMNVFLSSTAAATASATAEVSVEVSITAAFTGGGALGSNLETTVAIAAPLSGDGSLSAAVSTEGIAVVTAPLTGSGALSATLEAEQSIAAPLTGSGALTAAVRPVQDVQALSTGSGTLSAVVSAEIIREIEAVFTGSGALAAEVSTEGSSEVSAPFTGSGTLTASVEIVQSVEAVFSGLGALTSALAVDATVEAALTGSGSLAAVIQSDDAVVADAILTGSGALSAQIEISADLTAPFGSSGSLAVAVDVVQSVEAIFSGAGALSAVVWVPGSDITTVYLNGAPVTLSFGGQTVILAP